MEDSLDGVLDRSGGVGPPRSQAIDTVGIEEASPNGCEQEAGVGHQAVEPDLNSERTQNISGDTVEVEIHLTIGEEYERALTKESHTGSLSKSVQHIVIEAAHINQVRS